MLKCVFCRYAARHRSEIPVLIDTWFSYQLKDSTQKHSSRVFIGNIFSLEFIFWALMEVKLNDFTYLPLLSSTFTICSLQYRDCKWCFQCRCTRNSSRHSVLSDCHMFPRFTRKFNFSYLSIREVRPSLFRYAKNSRMIKSIIGRSLAPHFTRNCNKCRKNGYKFMYALK
jgi:hypothetical protein